MKKVAFGMLVLGLTTLGISQESAEANPGGELNNVPSLTTEFAVFTYRKR